MDSDQKCVCWVVSLICGMITACVVGYNAIATYEISCAMKTGYEQRINYTGGRTAWLWVKSGSPVEKGSK